MTSPTDQTRPAARLARPTNGPDALRLNPALLLTPDMRTALAGRDITTVFRLLQRSGVSQRRIAALTAQSQSEISEIIAGRQVGSYDVLLRIALGLGAPRGHLGLAFDDTTARLLQTSPTHDDASHQAGHGVDLIVGAAPHASYGWPQPPLAPTSPHLPHRSGQVDLCGLQQATAQLRILDEQYGGGACHRAVLAQIGAAQQLLSSATGGDADRALHIAAADLQLLAAWTAFDADQLKAARRHLHRALEHAHHADETSLIATAHCLHARISLHYGWAAAAVGLLHLGQDPAQASGLGMVQALMHSTLAWAHALTDPDQVEADISRANQAYHQPGTAEPLPWLDFLTPAELHALHATAWAQLPGLGAEQRAKAIDTLTLATTLRQAHQTRSRTLDLCTLAQLHLDADEHDHALHTARQALALAGQLHSQQVIDRINWLRGALDEHRHHTGLRELAQPIYHLSQLAVSSP